MLVAILLVRRSSFGAIWVDYCKRNSIEHLVLDAYADNVVEQCRHADIVMMDHHQSDPMDVLFAKQLLYSLEQSGKIVFPNFRTGWHFDDKLGQKYLFEALGVITPVAWAFYDRRRALEWLESASLPVVFKLRSGAASQNVKLVKTKRFGRSLINKAFSRGFPQSSSSDYVRDSWIQFRAGKKTLWAFLKSCARFIIPDEFTRMAHKEKGYVYFQDFIPNQGYDVRVTVVGARAMAFRRLTRKNDFRASASGFVIWDNEALPSHIVAQAFDLQNRMGAQTLSIDYVVSDTDGSICVLEVSYGFGFPKIAGGGIANTPSGYWTRDLIFHHSSRFSAVEWMIEDCIEALNKRINAE